MVEHSTDTRAVPSSNLGSRTKMNLANTKTSIIRNFDPFLAAKGENDMWKCYYRHRYIKLFKVTFKFAKSFFGIELIDSIRLAFYMTIAQAFFKIGQIANIGKETKGKENNLLIIFFIKKAYDVFNKKFSLNMNTLQLSKLEYRQWYIDRYPYKFKETREEAMADLYSHIYNVPIDRLMKYATLRSAAAVIRDEVEGRVEGVIIHHSQHAEHWYDIQNKLEEAYVELRRVVS